ncbi:unnamed protein product [Sphagnum tenellum]
MSMTSFTFLFFSKFFTQFLFLHHFMSNKAPLPPGQFGLPFLGESLELQSALQANKPHQFFNTRVAKYGEIFKTHLLFSPTVFVDGPEWNKFLFSNENKLISTTWPMSIGKLLGANSVANKIGEEHKWLRSTFHASFFGPSGLRNFVPRMDKIAKSHFEQTWESKGEIIAMKVIKKFAFSLVADLFLSITKGPEFESMAHDVEAFVGGIMKLPIDFPGTRYHKAMLARKSLLRTFDIIIARRQKDIEEGKVSVHHDLLSILMKTLDHESHVITNETIKDNILTYWIASHDTVNTTLSLALKYLFLNPHCLHEVVKEQTEIMKAKGGTTLNWEDTRNMKYTWWVIQETLRLQPTVGGAFRVTLKDFEYKGFTIPKGWKVLWSVAPSQMSPEIFAHPTKFDPRRFEGGPPPPFTFMPFGGGHRTCPGQEYARTVMMVFLHNLVLNYEWSMVNPNEKIVIDPMPVFQKGLQLKVQKKKKLVKKEPIT